MMIKATSTTNKTVMMRRLFIMLLITLLWTMLTTPSYCLAKKQSLFGEGGRNRRGDDTIHRRHLSFGGTTNSLLTFRKPEEASSSFFFLTSFLSSTIDATAAAMTTAVVEPLPSFSSSLSILNRIRGGGGFDDKRNTKKTTSMTSSSSSKVTTRVTTKNNNNKKKSSTPCAGDGNVVVATKTAGSVILQTLGLLTVMKLAQVAPNAFFPKHDDVLPKMFGLPLLQFLASIFIIFSSSTVKSWIQGGVIGAATNQVLKPNVVPGDMNWYQQLKKPWFNPPGWVFPIMWLLVSKPTQLIALIRILKASNSNSDGHYWPQLVIYCTHLSLGDAWNNVFFDCQRIGLGAYVIVTFFGMLVTSAVLFHMADEMAGLLMLPTCAWVTVATLLNIRIYQLNK